MPTTAQECANYEINLQVCPCTAEDCERRGICCECLQAHHGHDSLTACMKGAKRDPATLSLNEQARSECSLNQERNLEFCLCTYEPCSRKGICCNCVRNHFTTAGDDQTACMRAVA